jgi:glyoxylase-like metal-dependent hydrolase (beta-lactamase superfamily II)
MRTTLTIGDWSLSLLRLGVLEAIAPHEPLPVTALLCRRSNEVLLVDSGLGILPHRPIDPVTEISTALTAAGCPLSDVKNIYLTHLDADHIGGTVTGAFPGSLTPALPHATVLVLDSALKLVRQGTLYRAEEHAGTVIATLEGAGVAVRGVSSDSEIAPGVFVRSAPGHRESNSYVEIVAGVERFVFAGDVFHSSEELGRPDARRELDFDPAAAVASRHALLSTMRDGQFLGFSHSAGLGRAVRFGDSWRWHG